MAHDFLVRKLDVHCLSLQSLPDGGGIVGACNKSHNLGRVRQRWVVWPYLSHKTHGGITQGCLNVIAT